MQTNLIEAERISFAFGRRRVITDGSLIGQEGEFVGLVGSNRSGKTTLLRPLLDLVPLTRNRPDSRKPAVHMKRAEIARAATLVSHYTLIVETSAGRCHTAV